jgi:hydrogenase maturation protein HypF
VGYRPFVYRLAQQLGLQGWVRNEGARVHILIQGPAAKVESFSRDLIQQAPAIARPQLLEQHADALQVMKDFEILPSCDPAQADVHVPPDYFTCDACLQEMRTPEDRRYRYPFINCTQCGPRYTLIDALPYDRERTTMADFAMCGECQSEYTDPMDRRFHAEPIACPTCGPQLRFGDNSHFIDDTAAALEACVAALRRGHIVAIKGIGGYHLCCDANNPDAVARLRDRKPRPHKPLALMYPQRGTDGLDRLRQDTMIDELHAAVLCDPARPVVLLPARKDSRLCLQPAPGLNEIGAMLPYSPLHHLLLEEFDAPIVATSANVSGEPVLTEADDVQQRLTHITDAQLHHNRPIARPADDSVVRIIAGRPRPLRLGRGLAPLEIKLPFRLSTPLLACGGHMKNTMALAWEDRAVISPHIGDLEAPRSQAVFEQVIGDLQSLYRITPQRVVCDAHPGYASSRWAKRQAIPVMEVFHHRAHAAILAGEFPEPERWLVFTWDGVGYGEDGSLWGGEALLGRPGQWRRVAHWRPFRLPGAEQAGRQPWRSTLALRWETGEAVPPQDAQTALLHEAWRKGVNAPMTTAVGRLFDAAADMLGLCHEATFEGQGPMLLEACAADGQGEPLAFPLSSNNDLSWVQDWSPLLPMLLDNSASVADRAYRFHHSLAMALVDQATGIREHHGEFAVGLSGGVFQNRLLTEMVLKRLTEAGFNAYLPQRVPVNDGGLCFGQIIEAAAELIE